MNNFCHYFAAVDTCVAATDAQLIFPSVLYCVNVAIDSMSTQNTRV
jgi:hypothetical protein